MQLLCIRARLTESSIADSERSVILQQVSHGISVRMAIMAMVMGNQPPGNKTLEDKTLEDKTTGSQSEETA